MTEEKAEEAEEERVLGEALFAFKNGGGIHLET
jgi:hypothetical protein